MITTKNLFTKQSHKTDMELAKEHCKLKQQNIIAIIKWKLLTNAMLTIKRKDNVFCALMRSSNLLVTTEKIY